MRFNPSRFVANPSIAGECTVPGAEYRPFAGDGCKRSVGRQSRSLLM